MAMTPDEWPERITSEGQLNELLTRPSRRVVDMMGRLAGDIIVLGIGGKMGVTLGMLAARAIREAGVERRVIGVSRFSDREAAEKLRASGVETIARDLLDREAIAALPAAENVIFMVGRKFGTEGNEPLTWATNTMVPATVAQHFRNSRIVVFSTGNVYPMAPVAGGGCTEETRPAPIGEYAQSCLGRERVFQYYSEANGTPVCLLRLNYAIDTRYGVLHDIAQKVWHGESIDVTVGYFNLVWQGDANSAALLCLEHCASPPTVFNMTGREAVSTRQTAMAFGKIMGRPVHLRGTESDTAYLSNAANALRLLGGTTVSTRQMIVWSAHWVMAGGRSLGKPTHFEVRNGTY